MIKFYNTLHRKLEEFHPISENEVKMYTCGPTVYDYAHIGNFRAYIFEDLLRRFLEASGFNVTHVMNITDIDDKTIKRSQENNITLEDFTGKYINSFFEDIKTLNIRPAHHYPKATKFIEQMIAMVKILEEKGFAYCIDDGSVFFKVSKFKDYGKLANIDPSTLRSGQRVASDEYEKEEMRDFALWKGLKAGEGDIYWNSPWGKGRPGWHIECSVMSAHYLGDHFDIHCGGVDNIFPHHENEIAQSCAATGKEFVNYWLHNEHLMVDGQKMAKSLNNFYTLRYLLARGISPEAIRYTLISSHYKQKLNFTFEKLQSCQSCINRLRELKRRLELIEKNANGLDLADEAEKLVNEFFDQLSDDLNISGALGKLFTWVNKFFVEIDKNNVSYLGAENVLKALLKIDDILGVIETKSACLSDDIEKLIVERNQARKDRNWARADEIRAQLIENGIVLEDTSKGTIWKRKT